MSEQAHAEVGILKLRSRLVWQIETGEKDVHVIGGVGVEGFHPVVGNEIQILGIERESGVLSGQIDERDFLLAACRHSNSLWQILSNRIVELHLTALDQ